MVSSRRSLRWPTTWISLTAQLKPNIAVTATVRPFFLFSSASVVCARVSPSQKSTVVQGVRAANPNLITLAIGDGANDVPMIQTAHIGIGISGQEGLQAVNSSDYAIAQFRFLKKLVLVHGRWSARRIAFVINYIFYKNIFAVIPAFVFGFYNAMSGRLLFNVWMQQTFNLVTFVPIAVYGVLDRDVEANTAMQFPQLYSETKRGLFFSVPISGWWLVLSFIHAVVSYIIPYIAYSMEVDQGMTIAFSLACFL